MALGAMICVLMSLLTIPYYGYAKEPAAQHVVRVGCAGIKGFAESPDGEHGIGYGTAYLEAIAEKTGWKYVYVNAASWSQCVEMLKNGEIDILLPVIKDPEREDSFLFSQQQCCMNYVGLYTSREREDLYFDDFAGYDGMRVGLVTDHCVNKLLFDKASKEGFHVEAVYYGNEKQAEKALYKGEVDAIVNASPGPSSTEKVLSKLGVVPAYFMMDQRNAAHMKQLDAAMAQLQAENPYFEAELNAQYYKSFDTTVESWTREEAEFIKNCPPLRVVCDADSNPIEWRDKKTGEYKGIYVEILKMIAEESGLQFKFVSPQDVSDPWKAVQNGEGDLLSAAYGNDALGEAYQMCFSTPYYPEKNSIIGRRGRTFDPSEPMKIALLDSFISTQYYIKETHPQWEIVPCDSLNACMKAVEEGRADITMTDTITLPYNNYMGEFPALSVVSTMAEEGIPMAIGISMERDFDYQLLQSVINKATLRLSEEKVNSYVLSYTIERAAQVNIFDLMKNNPTQFLGIVFLVLAALFGASILVYVSRLKIRQNSELEKKNALLKNAVLAAEHARDMYDGLYNMAVCGIAQLEVRKNGHTTMLNANNEAKAILSGADTDNSDSRLFNTDLRHHIYNRDLARVQQVMEAIRQQGDRTSLEFRVTRSDRKVIWIRATIELVGQIEDEGNIIQSTFMDITEAKTMEEQLRNQSEKDSLTGMYNKGAMEHYSREYLESHREEPCAYCIMDIDDFKEINDTHGHWSGDKVLKEVSQIIRSVVRGRGIVGRFGGDELVILFKNTNEDEARKQAQMICSRMNKILVQDTPALVSGSIGVAGGIGYSYEELFENADRALYMAKQDGKNCVRLNRQER